MNWLNLWLWTSIAQTDTALIWTAARCYPAQSSTWNQHLCSAMVWRSCSAKSSLTKSLFAHHNLLLLKYICPKKLFGTTTCYLLIITIYFFMKVNTWNLPIRFQHSSKSTQQHFKTSMFNYFNCSMLTENMSPKWRNIYLKKVKRTFGKTLMPKMFFLRDIQFSR